MLMAGIWTYNKNNKTLFYYRLLDFFRVESGYTLFLGSSSIDRLRTIDLYACKTPVIYGFHNGKTEHISEYLFQADINEVGRVILYIGENDLATGKPYLQTFSELRDIVRNIRAQTQAPIGIVKIKYSPARASAHPDFLRLNTALEDTFDSEQQHNVRLIPFDSIRSSSFFSNDGIHLNRNGNRSFIRMLNDFCEG